jgi:hypothetical protein
MSTTRTLKPGNQLWGIYHTDRVYARVMGDPLRTVIEALTKLSAEEAAARLGFSELIPKAEVQRFLETGVGAVPLRTLSKSGPEVAQKKSLFA